MRRSRANHRARLAVTALEDRTVPTQVVTIIKLADTAEGGLTGAFRVSRTETTGPLVVGVVLSGTASHGYDYSCPIAASFADGVAEVVLHVFPTDDSISEPTETIIATVNYGGTPSSATMNIADNDPPSTVTIAALGNAIEGGSAGGFVLTRSQTSGSLSVNFTLSGTATSPSDYASPLIVSFVDGQATATVSITAADDSTAESTETVVMTITSGSYTVGTPASATINIYDNDAQYVSVEKTTDAIEGGSGGAFNFSRFGSTSGSLTVNYTVSGTATSGTDYTALSGTVTFAPGQAEYTLAVATLNDQLAEGSETVIVHIPHTPEYVSNQSAVLQIADDELATVSIVGLTDISEGSPASDAVVLSRVGGNIGSSLTVYYAVTGTAVPGSDYVSLTGSVTFAADQSQVAIPITSLADATPEDDESVTITLTSNAAYALGYAEGTAYILDQNAPVAGDDIVQCGVGSVNFSPLENDTDPDGDLLTLTSWTQPANGTLSVFEGIFTYTPNSTLSGSDSFTYVVSDGRGGTDTATVTLVVPPRVSVQTLRDASEGAVGTGGVVTGKFQLVRSGDTSQSLVVQYHVDPASTATSAVDFVGLTGTATFGVGQSVAEVDVYPTTDGLGEGFETLLLVLDPSAGYAVDTGLAEMKITDGLQVVSVEMRRDGVEVGPSGTALNGQFTFTRSSADLSQALDIDIAIDASTVATEGVDFATLTRTVRIEAGQTTATLTIPVLQDSLTEVSEALAVRIVDRPGFYLPLVAAPATLIIVDELLIQSVTWTPHAGPLFGNPLDANPNAGGGQRIFAEKTSPAQGQARRTLVLVTVQLSAKVDNQAVHLRMYDVDDPSSNQAPVDDETTTTDNRGARTVNPNGMSHGVEAINDSTNDAAPSGGTKTQFTGQNGSAVFGSLMVWAQPGNNYRVAASLFPNAGYLASSIKPKQNDGTQARLEEHNGTNVSFVPTANAKIVMSEMLTVWRKLHVERDHMGVPGAGEKFSDSNPAPLSTHAGYDDVNPGGPIADPSIELMIANYRPAYIEVVDDLGTLNVNKEGLFVHNLITGDRGELALRYVADYRDVRSQDSFWVLQIFGAYEEAVGTDNDPAPVGFDTEFTYLGYKPGASLFKPQQGPCLVYTETIRDVLAALPLYWPRPSPAEGVLRTAFHESLHSFNLVHGTPPGDDGPMTLLAVQWPTRSLTELTPALLAWVRATKWPM